MRISDWSSDVCSSDLGRELFRGDQLHSARYRNAQPFAGKRVLIVGGGNSGAQVLAEVSEVAETIWVTLKEPIFLPDDVDGRAPFAHARVRVRGAFAKAATTTLGDLVLVPPMKEYRAPGV